MRNPFRHRAARLNGPELDREIDRLAELYPEDGDIRMESADRQRADDLVAEAEAEEAVGLGIPAEDRQAAADLAAEQAAADTMSPAEREQRDRELMREVYENLWPEDREAG